MQCFLHKQKIHLTKLWKVEVISFLWRVWDFVLFAICFIYYFNFFELFFGFVLIFLCGWGVFCFCFFFGGAALIFLGGGGLFCLFGFYGEMLSTSCILRYNVELLIFYYNYHAKKLIYHFLS